MNEAPHDPYPDLVATIDQLMADAPLLARWAWALFGAFKAEGFSDDQALRLTMNQTKLVSRPSRKSNSPRGRRCEYAPVFTQEECRMTVVLTDEEAQALCSVIRKVWQLGGLAPGQQLSPYENEVWGRFAQRVVEIANRKEG